MKFKKNQVGKRNPLLLSKEEPPGKKKQNKKQRKRKTGREGREKVVIFLGRVLPEIKGD